VGWRATLAAHAVAMRYQRGEEPCLETGAGELVLGEIRERERAREREAAWSLAVIAVGFPPSKALC